MYVKWSGVCNLLCFLLFKVFVDFADAYVIHVRLDLFVVLEFVLMSEV